MFQKINNFIYELKLLLIMQIHLIIFITQLKSYLDKDFYC